MPLQTIHLALPLTWCDGGTWISSEPHTISFLGLGRWKSYFGQSSLKRPVSHSSALNLRYLGANTKLAFRSLLIRSGSFFSLIVSILYLKCISTLLLQIQADLCSSVAAFSCRVTPFILCFFSNFLCGSVKDWWSTTKTLVNLTTSPPGSCF